MGWTRSFMYIDDCVQGTKMLMDSDISEPLNIGSAELISINDLTDMVAKVAGIEITRSHDLSAPQGVRGRNSDNAIILEKLGWEPTTPLGKHGANFEWISAQVGAETSARDGCLSKKRSAPSAGTQLFLLVSAALGLLPLDILRWS